MATLFETNGFEIIEEVYSNDEIKDILGIINQKDLEKKFGVREFLIKNPELINKIFTKNLLNILKRVSPNCNRAIKSIYFDKPPHANWIVNWHQDLTINLKAKKETLDFKNWRVTAERTIVQPSLSFLENIFTVRIHLDNCTKTNGALRVIKSSHKNGVIPIKDWLTEKKGEMEICEVKKGGILLMKPLTLHASRRTENQMNRRVIHIEFCETELPNNLEWKEEILFQDLRENLPRFI